MGCLWSMTPSEGRGIKTITIRKVVEGEDTYEEEFKKAFLMMVLNDIICATTCQCMSINMLHVVVIVGAFPRIRVWTKGDIDKANKDDVLDSGDFRKLGVNLNFDYIIFITLYCK